MMQPTVTEIDPRFSDAAATPTPWDETGSVWLWMMA